LGELNLFVAREREVVSRLERLGLGEGGAICSENEEGGREKLAHGWIPS
jgi:hypothetical protein